MQNCAPKPHDLLKNCSKLHINQTKRPQNALYIVLKANKNGKTEHSSKNHIVSRFYSVKHLIENIYYIDIDKIYHEIFSASCHSL